MDTSLFLAGDELTELVGNVGAYAAAGIGFAVAVYIVGYVVWFVIDMMRGGV